MNLPTRYVSIPVAVLLLGVSSCQPSDRSSGDAVVPQRTSPRKLAVSPLPRSLEGRLIFASDRDGDYELYVLDLPSRDIRQLTHNDVDDYSPDWSPDGRSVVFTRERPQPGARGGLAATAIMRMRHDGREQTVLTPRPAINDDPEWSPNGRRIAFTWGELSHDGSSVGVMQDDGSGLDSVIFDGSNAIFEEPSWSPSGRELVFIWEDGIGRAAARCCNRNRRFVLDGYADQFGPSWSPDGHELLFSATHTRCKDPRLPKTCEYEDDTDLFVADALGLFVADALGADPLVRRFKEPFDSQAGTWSPSGEHIVFYSRRRGSFDIFVTNRDGSDIRRLTHHPSDDIHPDWFIRR